MKNNPIVSRQEWVEIRKQHLQKEKQLTRLRDELSAERRRLPWVRVDKPYVFEGPRGRQSMAELFDGASQLMTYHFMLGPNWKEGCPSCSFLADHIDGALIHLKHRDVKLMAVSRAPYSQIAPFKRRMGWQFDWVSSYGSDFNYDFQASHTPESISNNTAYYNYDLLEYPVEDTHGISVFYKDESGDIFHTYSSYARGCEMFVNTYNFLDIAPKGRDEDGLEFTMAWVRHHDRYGDESRANTNVTHNLADEVTV
jgi:predicted dithiol-disulfide oxidoreductase (DUF899 family)